MSTLQLCAQLLYATLELAKATTALVAYVHHMQQQQRREEEEDEEEAPSS